jgi:cytochrome b561
MIANSAERYGLFTRLLHWSMAALIIAALALGAYVARMEPAISNLWLYGAHKTLGASILALAVLRLGWHRLSPPPPIVPSRAPRADALARLTHRAFYVLLIAVPLAGWVASSATGIDTVIFGRWTLPSIAPASPALEDAVFAIHRWAARLLALLVLLHLAGAILRQTKGEPALRRIVKGR